MPKINQWGYNLKLVILFVVTVLITLLIITFYNSDNNQKVVVGDNGFSISNLTINKGATVAFIIEGKSPHWPASDPHPTHEGYPEKGGCVGSKLDACRPLKKGEKYSFTFDKVGMWGLHDHLFHGNTMIIIVRNRENFSLSSVKESLFSLFRGQLNCGNYDFGGIDNGSCKNGKTGVNLSSNISSKETAEQLKAKCNTQQACYKVEFQNITKRKGYVFAFNVINELKKIDAGVAGSCHGIAHNIGWAVYDVDPQHWKENLRKINTSCSWGALHGIVEQYIAITHNKLDKNSIKSLCQGVAPCNHGVGHLLLVQTNNVIAPALEICTVLPTLQDRNMCMTGVFMERMTLQNLVNDSPETRYNYWKNRLGEFENLCESFEGEENAACWAEIARPAIANFQQDPHKIFDFCNKSSTQEGSKYCRRRAISDLVLAYKFDLAKLKDTCEIAPKSDISFPRDCYIGIASVAMENLPKERKKEVVNYCESIPFQYINDCKNVLNGISLKDNVSVNSVN